jgi:transposase
MKSYYKFLSDEERKNLIYLHRREGSSRYADRIKVILWLDKGLSFKKISGLLFINDQTVRNYLDSFESKGSAGLLCDSYTGYRGKLTEKQEAELTEHLKTVT